MSLFALEPLPWVPSAGALSDGAMAEHLAVARLLELGRKVAVPVVDDDGVDLVVDYRTTVQVKSSALHVHDGRERYRFHVSPERGGGPRVRDQHVGVFLLYGRDTGEWWVVRGEDVGSAVRLARTPGVGRDLAAWHVFDA